jgi:hypothetical protein
MRKLLSIRFSEATLCRDDGEAEGPEIEIVIGRLHLLLTLAWHNRRFR